MRKTRFDDCNFIRLIQSQEDCNVIIVDWSRGAKTLNYVFAAGNSALVGRQLSLLTQRLLKAYGLNASSVHCIGHSLGGHAAGFFGRHFKEKTGMLIGRISGNFFLVKVNRGAIEEVEIYTRRKSDVSSWGVTERSTVKHHDGMEC